MNDAAHNPDAPFVYCHAAAGSGKTFTLVFEYLRLAMSLPPLDKQFRSILAITFTNKAAAEMKGRIMEELETLADEGVDADDGMGAQLLAALAGTRAFPGRTPSPDELQRMAATLQRKILHNYTDLSVATIDSFMHRIVRTFAHDLGHSPDFEVVKDWDMLVEDTVDRLMAMVGTPEAADLTAILRAWADSNMEADKGYNVEGDLRSLASLLAEEDVGRHLQQLDRLTPADFLDIQRSLTAQQHDSEARLRAIGKEAVELLQQTSVTDNDCYHRSQGFLHWFHRLAVGDMVEPNSYVVASLTGGKMVTPGCDKGLAAVLETLRPRLEQLFAKAQHFFEHDMVDYNSRAMILDNLYATALLGRLYRIMDEYLHDEHLLPIAEFNRMINNVVEDEDNPAPFIFERLGNRYRHFLVDEFQDTSVMQWHNLVPLIENGVAHGYGSLVVGDGKQAIYRFRQGDVRQFLRLPHVDGMRHHGTTLALPGNSRLLPLGTNYRTMSAVVDFNNDFFSDIVRKQFHDDDWIREVYVGRDNDGRCREAGDEELRQTKHKTGEGHVCIAMVDSKVRTDLYAEVRDTVQMLVNERGYAYRDIMILARSNSQLADLGAWLAVESDIPQTSSQSFLLRSSDAAMAVVAALRLVHDPGSRAAAVELVQRMQRLGIVADGVDAAVMVGDMDAFTTRLASLSGGIKLDTDELASRDVYDMCEDVVRRLRIDGIDMPYIGTLLDAAATFAASHRQNLGEFLQWLDDNPDISARVSDKLDAVQMLTIHKAKGLQKPVVVCMFLPAEERMPSMWVDVPEGICGDGPQLPTAYVRFKKNTPNRFADQCDAEMDLARLDDLNVLYVALTRPEDQLFVLCQRGKAGYPALLEQYISERQLEAGADGRVHLGDAGWHKQVGGSGSKKKRAKDKTVLQLHRLSFADWTSRVSIASPSERATTSLLEDKVRFGIYAHELLSSIRCAADVDIVMTRFRERYPLEADEAAALEHLVHAAVEGPASSRFFDASYQSVAELDIYDKGKMSRPDRVVFTPDATWVVDFKTGMPTAENATQVREYCRIVSSMGYPDVSGWLLYLHLDGVDVVPV